VDLDSKFGKSARNWGCDNNEELFFTVFSPKLTSLEIRGIEWRKIH